MAVTPEIQAILDANNQTLNGINNLINTLSSGSSGGGGTVGGGGSGRSDAGAADALKQADANKKHLNATQSLTKQFDDARGEIKYSVNKTTSSLVNAASSIESGAGGLQASFDAIGAAGGTVALTVGTFGKGLVKGTKWGREFSKQLEGNSKEAKRFRTAMSGARISLGLMSAALGFAIKQITGTWDAFNQMSAAGATFGGRLVEMREAAASSGVSLKTFQEVVASSTQKLATFGGTSTNGAKMLSSVGQAIRTSGLDNTMLLMGISQKEQLEIATDYMDIVSRSGQLQYMSQYQIAQGTAAYAKDLKLLSELTGESSKKMQESMDRQKADAAFQASMVGMSAEERKKTMAMEAHIREKYGETAAQRFKEQVAFGGAMSEATAKFDAFMPTMSGVITSTADARGGVMDFAKGLISNKDSLAAEMKNTADLAKYSGIDSSLKVVGEAFLAGQKAYQFANEATIEDLKKLEESLGKGDAATQTAAKTMKAFNDILTSLRETGVEIFKALFGEDMKVAAANFKELMGHVVDFSKWVGGFIKEYPTLAAGLAMGAVAAPLAPAALMVGKVGFKGAKAGVGAVARMFGKKGAGEAVETGAEVAAKTVGKGAAKTAGKGVAKSLAKKIAGLGLLFGLGFAVDRMLDGDFTGAGMEIASGAASLVPGVGTAASGGIDAALMARDIGNERATAKEQEKARMEQQAIEKSAATNLSLSGNELMAKLVTLTEISIKNQQTMIGHLKIIEDEV